MNDQRQETRHRILRITRRLEKRLGLAHWLRIVHQFNEDGEDEAKCNTDWAYRQAVITWSLNLLADRDDAEIQLTAVHEYVHALINPIASQAPDEPVNVKLEELSVESVARVICHALAD